MCVHVCNVHTYVIMHGSAIHVAVQFILSSNNGSAIHVVMHGSAIHVVVHGSAIHAN